MKAILVVTVVLLWAGAALAQPADPDPDGIGIYFDEGATTWCTDVASPSQVTAYLCLTRASDLSGFVAWEGRIEASDGCTISAFQIRGDGTNNATEPEFVVTYGTPLAYALSTVLLDITVDVEWEWAVGLRVWAASTPSGPENLPAYATVAEPATFRTLGYSWGWDEGSGIPNWCAGINDANCPDGPSVAAPSATWSGVKALYRD